MRGLDPCLSGDLGERAVAVVAVERIRTVHVDHEQVEPAVVVVVAKRAPNRSAGVGDAGLRGDVGKRAVAAIVVEGVRCTQDERHAIGHVDVEPAIVVHVPQRGREAIGLPADTGHLGGVRKRAVAIVAVQAVGGITPPAVTGDEDVEVAVPVIVEEERGPTAARTVEASLVRDLRERAIAVVAIQVMRILDGHGEQIGVAITVVIAPGAPARPAQGSNAELRRHVAEGDGGGPDSVRWQGDAIARRQVAGIVPLLGVDDAEIPAGDQVARLLIDDLLIGLDGLGGLTLTQIRYGELAAGWQQVGKGCQHGRQILLGSGKRPQSQARPPAMDQNERMTWCGLQNPAEVVDGLLEPTFLGTLHAQLKFLEQLLSLGMPLKRVRCLKGSGGRQAGNDQHQQTDTYRH